MAMPATYNSSNTALDRARRLLGDTGAVFLLQDEEIEAELNGEQFNEAVAVLAEGLAAQFAQYPDETDTPGGHKLKYSDRCKTWLELAKRLRARPNRGTNQRVAYLGNMTNPTENRLR